MHSLHQIYEGINCYITIDAFCFCIQRIFKTAIFQPVSANYRPIVKHQELPFTCLEPHKQNSTAAQVSIYFFNSCSSRRAASIVSCGLPNVEKRKYPSPQAPNPSPGVPTT